MSKLLLVFLFLFLVGDGHVSSSSFLLRYLKKSSSSSSSPLVLSQLRPSQPNSESELVANPSSFDHLKSLAPSCVLSVALLPQPLPTSVLYSPPSDCPSPWSHVSLHIRVTSPPQHQSNHLLSLWLGGAELLRTSTDGAGCWEVQKDITRYSSLLSQSSIHLMLTSLQRPSNIAVSWAHLVNVTLFYYNHDYSSVISDKVTLPATVSGGDLKRNLVSLHSFDDPSPSNSEDQVREAPWRSDDTPPDLIIPVNGDGGFWFRIDNESTVQSKDVQLPHNARRAVLELYVSSHGSDELWYSNVPREIEHRAFREVFVTIDGKIVGSESPIIVLPFGAFSFPSCDIELTPIMGSMLDGKPHRLGIGVSHGIPYWLASANLHVWLDHQSSAVEAKSILHHYPALHYEQVLEKAQGSLKVKAKRKIKLLGWLKTSRGNFTTYVSQELEFESFIRYGKNETCSGSGMVEHEIESEREVLVKSETGEVISKKTAKRKYHVTVSTQILPEFDDLSVRRTTLNMSVKEKHVERDGSRYYHLTRNSAELRELKEKDQAATGGSVKTEQRLSYKDERGGCYSRTVVAVDGKVIQDETTDGCATAM
ncbi:hypothetical protein EUGRSUZ_G03384 [Eucalyptus grandis]|uniref:Peptide N-acetyl-beta-D-glucosaminyl asparaginase amidase A N-terminal domain-containing protein n=2 Tax=Eucalyptus grandis TaxID=71139 RepID=A0A059BIR2_EUCGR|nr:hypothetical protein EUGRSUZ_G03384 [Eucalyptus grandis]